MIILALFMCCLYKAVVVAHKWRLCGQLGTSRYTAATHSGTDRHTHLGTLLIASNGEIRRWQRIQTPNLSGSLSRPRLYHTLDWYRMKKAVGARSHFHLTWFSLLSHLDPTWVSLLSHFKLGVCPCNATLVPRPKSDSLTVSAGYYPMQSPHRSAPSDPSDAIWWSDAARLRNS